MYKDSGERVPAEELGIDERRGIVPVLVTGLYEHTEDGETRETIECGVALEMAEYRAHLTIPEARALGNSLLKLAAKASLAEAVALELANHTEQPIEQVHDLVSHMIETDGALEEARESADGFLGRFRSISPEDLPEGLMESVASAVEKIVTGGYPARKVEVV